MRDHICPDCGQLVRHVKWAGHIIKHGRIVPDPHSRTTLASEEGEQEAAREPARAGAPGRRARDGRA